MVVSKGPKDVSLMTRTLIVLNRLIPWNGGYLG
jgi:hypothetical protein